MESGRNTRFARNKAPAGVFWKPAPSPWKKEFYFVVGQMEWGRLMHLHESRHLSPNVNAWDASAGKEALENAWRRFWRLKKGLSCDTPLPDPDEYIDEIDWDTKVDPELCRDLENYIPPSCRREDQDNVESPVPEFTPPLPSAVPPLPLPVPVPVPIAQTFGWQVGDWYNGGYSWAYMAPPPPPPAGLILWSYNNNVNPPPTAFVPAHRPTLRNPRWRNGQGPPYSTRRQDRPRPGF